MTAPNDATRAQTQAARPDMSTWLAANAGSGKTRVLTDRVARLLLAGVPPERILCLTYTKAAASEMQNRLFQRLGTWAMMTDTDLEKALLALGTAGADDPVKRAQARTLFASAIETPGGLKIQTIHSFCSAVLRRFPLEAGVSPQFKEIEDRAADLLRAEILDSMAEGEHAHLVAELARHYTGEDFAGLTRAIAHNSDAFYPRRTWEDICHSFEIGPDINESIIEDQVLLGDEQAILDTMIPPMLAKGGNDEKDALRLQALGPLSFDSFPLLETVFLTGSGAKIPFAAKIGSFPTKPTQDKITGVLPALGAFMGRVEDARALRLSLSAARKTLALHQFAAAFLPIYGAEKQTRGWLDFDDLIRKARQLLTDPQVAAWVLYRIDGGIDHILVDEAQDTSPTQWDVVRKLAAEFSSGQGARQDVERTIFVVGDKKQSIYSFQGADPREFDRMEAEFDEKLKAASLPFQSKVLEFSFRSSPAILKIVDCIFEDEADAGFPADNRHIAFKKDLPGRVDLWPVVEPEKTKDDREWFDPLDRKGETHHTVKLADQIAIEIKRMIDEEVTIPDEDPDTSSLVRRPVRPGDFLILVQQRRNLFAEIIRACKGQNLEIAGADRLKVGAELAVRDLAALLSFLATPDDSLSLATALRSPLFGWDEQTLFSLAHHRTQDHLWQALRDQDTAHPETLSVLRDLRNQADFLRPYDLIERILTRHQGRKKLLARLGSEAEDGINALLSQALAYEQTAVPSLTGFLVWMQTDELEIKRQVDAGSDQIRVMTVHGAKGLEAPIVVLPDTGAQKLDVKDDIIEMDGLPVWKANADDMPNQMTAAINVRKSDQASERLRLLYVALTRAEKWLIVAAAGELPKNNSSWYQRVQAALQIEGAGPLDTPNGAGLRLEYGDWHGLPLTKTTRAFDDMPNLDPFYGTNAPLVPDALEVLSPSDLGGAKALAGDQGMDEDAAKAYGTSVHEYLEHLAHVRPDDWDATLATMGVSHPTTDDAALEAKAVLAAPQLSFLFGPDSLSEVDITARLGVHVMQGAIDRLIIEPNRILVVDFKTNRTVPNKPEDTPLGLLRQMGAYAHGLAQIYPDHKIETGILWTRTRTFMPLPHDIVTEALQSMPYLDDTSRAT